MPSSIWLLMGFAALVMTSAPLLVLAGGILGHQLSPSESFKTLPIALFVLGAAVSMYPVIRLMGAVGRKAVFLGACGAMAAGALLAAASTLYGQFYLFCGAAFVLGGAQAVFTQVRFAAMELVDEHLVARAASRIMLSGLVAALLGPELYRWGLLLTDKPFVGGFILLALLAGLAAAILGRGYSNHYPARPVSLDGNTVNIWHNPLFWAAVVAAAVAYGIMSLIMTATPLNMHVHHDFDLLRTKEVIQAHIFSMFLPSFFSGWLITRIGALNVILVGAVFYAITIAVAFVGSDLINFWVALILLGFGWNFMFVSATSLLPIVARGQDSFRVQGANDLTVVVFQASASLGAGWMLAAWGWQDLLMFCVPWLLLCFVLVILTKKRFGRV